MFLQKLMCWYCFTASYSKWGVILAIPLVVMAELFILEAFMYLEIS